MAVLDNISPAILVTTQGQKQLMYAGANNILYEIGTRSRTYSDFISIWCGGTWGGDIVSITSADLLTAKNAGNGSFTPIVELSNGNKIGLRNYSGQFLYPCWQDTNGVNHDFNDGWSYDTWIGRGSTFYMWFFVGASYPNKFGVEYFGINAGQTSVTPFGVCYSFQRGTYQKNISDWETLINGSIPIVYEWEPYEHLTGNDGQFNLELTQIDASIIGDGETLTYVTDDTKVNVIPRTNLYNLAVNMLDGQEYIIAYCGDNYLTIKRRTDVIAAGTDIYITLKFYFRSDTAIFTSGEYRLRMVGDFPHVTYWLSMIYDEENEVAAPLLLGGTWYVASTEWNYTFGGESLPSETQLSALYIWLQDNGNAQSNNPYGTGTTDNGGDPEGNRQQDHITAPSLPSCGGLDLGLVTLYRPDAGQLANIAAFLWSDNVLDNFKKYFNNFADNILSLYSLPFTPSGLPTKTFTIGKMTSTVTGVEYCTVRFFDIDMGQVEIKNKWGSYLDYSPYTKIELYLPYLGNHTLDTDELMSPARMDGSMPDKQGTVLSLVYRLDILTGVIVALVKVRVYTKTGGYTDEIRYQFSGKVGSTTPLTGVTYANMVNAILSAGAGLATTIATGGLTAPLTAAAAVTGTVQASKPNVERIGAISGDASMLATNVPYICISVPNKPYLDQQEIYTGFPSYKAGTLGSFEGFTQVIEAHVEGISCTEEERTLILKWLKEGVII